MVVYVVGMGVNFAMILDIAANFAITFEAFAEVNAVAIMAFASVGTIIHDYHQL